MFAFLPFLPSLSSVGDDVHALAERVDTACHHGVPNGCILEFNLRTMLAESNGFDPFLIISGGGRPMALRDAVAALHRGAEDPRVGGLIARVQLPPAPIGAVQALREAIAAFSAVKPSVAWAETYPGTLSYYLATAFREIWMQPSGEAGLIGFASNAMFLCDALDKVGIEAQFVARGEYKSAADLFTEDGYTDANREAVTRMLESLQDQAWHAVAQSRQIDAGVLDELADKAPLLRDEALSSGLIDRIGFRDEAYARIAELARVEGVSPESIDTADKLPRMHLARYAGIARPRLAPPVPSIPGRRGKPTIAVVSVEGPIVNGRGGPQGLPLGPSSAGGDTIASALGETAADDEVSAIVLRVDSPGGSVTASETIWREVQRARDRGKSVVASMGSIAASGGYYVSMGADAIVANPGTITGSIGVITGKLVVRDLKDRLGVGSETLRTNANADAWSIDAPFTDEQRARREAEADMFYTDFAERVARGRNLRTEDVDAVARGRVWTGADALERGLVDELGGFRTAVPRAKVLAGLDEDTEVRPVGYPGSLLLDLLWPRGSSRPVAASVPEAVGALVVRSVAGAVGQVEQTLTGANVLWLGRSRF
ncbi:signal peptide peptidase SppA [Mycobacterium ulcerans]|uniref:Signal peptide peptidase SppA n=1 Tax=Mycobacterium ulcerans TaxID=1809 RepID=A0ABY3VBH5_MYCUL|nr:signal peptide peptidase SppA [Mycobacterium ulcerans]UDM34062.1 signal peptide peptidase SppA [Mycobacterium ulcerans]ULP51382.1 signal peptide peptidase SppA [Mycobacterium ulcerans]